VKGKIHKHKSLQTVLLLTPGVLGIAAGLTLNNSNLISSGIFGIIVGALGALYVSRFQSLFPSRGEKFYAEALRFIVDQNLDHIQKLIEYRKKT
jgi:hypothetical protein